MNTEISVALAISLPSILFALPAQAYDRQQSMKYVSTWWNSTSLEGQLGQGASPVGTVDHINNPPYVWYYSRFGLSFHDDGTGGLVIPNCQTVPFLCEEDCTNWASQVLKFGGVNIIGAVDGSGGTEISVPKLRAGLLASGMTEEDWLQGQPPPGDLVPGDIVQFNNMHTAVIVSTGVQGGGLALAAHSHDRNFYAINNYFNSWNTPGSTPVVARGFHISNDTISIPPALSDMEIKLMDLFGQPLATGATTYESGVIVSVTDPVSVGDIEVTEGAPIVNASHNLDDGVATYVFSSYSSHGTSSQFKVSNLNPGHYYVQGFNGSGDLTIQSFNVGALVGIFGSQGGPAAEGNLAQGTTEFADSIAPYSLPTDGIDVEITVADFLQGSTSALNVGISTITIYQGDPSSLTIVLSASKRNIASL